MSRRIFIIIVVSVLSLSLILAYIQVSLASVERPLSQPSPPGTPISLVLHAFAGKYVEFQVPSWYEETIREFDMVRVADQGYLMIADLTGTHVPKAFRPTAGYPTYFGDHDLQIIRYNASLDFGHWGNPIQIGSAFWVRGEPKWAVYFHEMGHNYHVSESYMNLLLGTNNSIGVMVEGFASISSMYVLNHLTEEPRRYGIGEKAYGSILQEYAKNREQYITAFRVFEGENKGLQSLDRYSSTGLLLILADRYGWDIFKKFFGIFVELDKQDKSLVSGATTEEKRVSFLVAALSVSSGEDLSPLFRSLKFPMDEGYYLWLLDALKKFVLR